MINRMLNIIGDLQKQAESLQETLQRSIAKVSQDLDLIDSNDITEQQRRELTDLIKRAQAGKATVEDAQNLLKKYGS